MLLSYYNINKIYLFGVTLFLTIKIVLHTSMSYLRYSKYNPLFYKLIKSSAPSNYHHSTEYFAKAERMKKRIMFWLIYCHVCGYIHLLLQTKIKDAFTRIKHGGAREIHRKVWTHGKIFISSHQYSHALKQLFFQSLLLSNSEDLLTHHKHIRYLSLPASLCENKLYVYFVWVKRVLQPLLK